jgi:nucleoside-diphosphate-sugar epimerase
MNKVLITGGNGFIGRRLCSELSLSKRKIIKIVRQKQPNDNSEQYVCNLAFNKVPDDLFEGIDTIFHLVGVTHDLSNKAIQESLYKDLNIKATEELAKTAVKKGIKKFIYISSVKAGGTQNLGRCMDENDQFEPEGIYGRTKREAELRLLEIGSKSSMNVSIIRPALVYGPGVKGNLAEMLLGIKKGWFPPLPENGNRRTMIHVDDLVRIMLLVELDERANGEIFIATDGNIYSSNQIYRAICKSLDVGIKKWVVPTFLFFLLSKIGDLINVFLPFPFNTYRYKKLLGDECFSSKKIEKKLGFKASHSIFSTSID